MNGAHAESAGLRSALASMPDKTAPGTLSGSGSSAPVRLATTGSLPRMSVVVPTFRRPDLLRRCLQALCAQTITARAFEIIVVDDGRSADTRQVVDDVAFAVGEEGPRVVCLEPKGTRGPAGARNRGWRAARGDIIAFTDDDTIPAPTWLAAGERVMQLDGKVAAIAGAVVVPIEGEPTDHARNTHQLENAGFVTANCFVRREALEQIGGFDERFTRAWREDSDLAFSLRAAGLRVISSARPVVVHPVRPVPWGFAVRSHKNLLFDALLYKKHPERYRAEVRRTPPWRYYATVLSFIAMLVFAWRGISWASAISGSLWLALTLEFAGRRMRGTSRRLAHRIEVLLTSFAIPFVAIFWRLAGALRWRVLFL
jgi:GT2 family glycosyltransferase